MKHLKNVMPPLGRLTWPIRWDKKHAHFVSAVSPQSNRIDSTDSDARSAGAA